ncbi:MAG: PHP domain-containing protein [Candidatus Aenigmarchaeota archaeon]|nr:PHP domain-containing protein [Candidatus Aenigmarchaeota archaeon]
MLTELHTHTIFSKGTKLVVEGIDGPEQMLKTAKLKGIQAMAITDHDTIDGYLHAKKLAKKYDVFLIPGEEVTTADGHLVALGITDFIKPQMSLEETLDVIHKQGGIGISSHPFDLKKCGLKEKAQYCDAIEAYNSINLERISNWKARKFAKKWKKPVTAGSDAHSAEMIGNGLNEISAEKDVDSIIKAIKKGKNKITFRYAPISVVRRWSVIRFKYAYEQTFSHINKNYKGPKKQLSLAMLNLVKKSPGPIDYPIQALACFGVSCSIIYSGVRELIGI